MNASNLNIDINSTFVGVRSNVFDRGCSVCNKKQQIKLKFMDSILVALK